MNTNSERRNECDSRRNPFFEPYDTPHSTVPFDRIRIEDYEEAFMEGIRRDKELIEKIISNPDKPTFDNTIIYHEEGKEYYYDLLSRVSTVFFNLLSAETNDEMDALAQKMQPILTKHANDIKLNRQFFERVKYVHRHHRKLTSEEKKLLEDVYQSFVRSGAMLSEEGKSYLRELTEEVAGLSLQFSQNLLKENKAYFLHITEETQLDGLPDTVREAAAMEAKERGLEGWVFTLDSPSFGPFMTYCKNRELRKRLFMAKSTVCMHDNGENNFEICRGLVNGRMKYAQLLGFRTFADYVLKRRMATKRQEVYRLLDSLADAYKPTAVKEQRAICSIARRLRKPAERNEEVEAWDMAYYAHKLKLQRYDIDAEMLRPYLELNRVIEGVFGLANRLYGITFKENKDIPVYHPDVKAYEVFDKDGSYLAVFYADFHPRKGKQGGAWMTEYQGQWIDRKGVNVRPHVSVVMNLTKPTEDKPALLTLGEVETFLHEFGHSLHGMFANTRFESLSGTNVAWDFVELPSQFMENYAIEKEFLRTFAFHYQTGEALPDELIDRVVKSSRFNVAISCLRQLAYGYIDMGLYCRTEELDDARRLQELEWKAVDKVALKAPDKDTCMTVQFSHIMSGGYSAGYYSYKWAEVLVADAFSVFKRNGIFDRATAERFRECILSKGGTIHPMTLYRQFRGGEPTINAILRRDGIKGKAAVNAVKDQNRARKQSGAKSKEREK